MSTLTIQVPIPPSYISRLKIIYAIVTKTIYNAEGIITSTETSPGHFEAFMTIHGTTLKYNDLPQKYAASIEALAIYYSLKQMTNVLGYQIIDLNYPVLSQVWASISNLSLHIGLLEECVLDITTNISSVYTELMHLINQYTMTSSTIKNANYLDNTVHQLACTMTALYNSIISSSDDFKNLKVI